MYCHLLIEGPTIPDALAIPRGALREGNLVYLEKDGKLRFAPVTILNIQDDTLIISSGLAPGDRVVLVSENRPEWLIADLAIMAAGCITVPAYTTNLPQDHLHIIDNSGARAVIVSTCALAARVLPAALDGSNCEMMIAMEPPEVKQYTGVRLLHWDAVMASGETGAGEVSRWVEGLRRTDTACVIYTSGTGGAPKGVMLSHRTLYLHALSLYTVYKEVETMVNLHTIPLFHANGWGHPQASTYFGVKQVMAHGFNPAEVLRLIEEHGATDMYLVPEIGRASCRGRV